MYNLPFWCVFSLSRTLGSSSRPDGSNNGVSSLLFQRSSLARSVQRLFFFSFFFVEPVGAGLSILHAFPIMQRLITQVVRKKRTPPEEKQASFPKSGKKRKEKSEQTPRMGIRQHYQEHGVRLESPRRNTWELVWPIAVWNKGFIWSG